MPRMMKDDRLERLQRYARMETPIEPDALAEAVSQMCVAPGAPLDPVAARLAHDILVRIYHSTHKEMRQVLAMRFAARADAPHDLVLALANDAIDIARPVIVQSPVLDDDDLVRLIIDHGHEHRLAVVDRASLSERVCDVLVHLGNDAIILKLVAHPGASLSDHAVRRLVVISRHHPDLHAPLLKRREMRATLAAAMYHWVADDLKAFITKTFGEEVSAPLEAEVDAVADVLSRRPAPTMPRPPNNFPMAVTDTFPSSASHLLVALRKNKLSLVEKEMERLTRLPNFAVQRILYNDNGEALAVVCRSIGLSKATFEEIFSHLHGVPPFEAIVRSKEFAKASGYFTRLSTRQADLILDEWRSRPRSVWGDPNRFNAAWGRRGHSLLH